MTHITKSNVKVFAIADLHGRYSKIVVPDDADIVVLAGDIIKQKRPNKRDISESANLLQAICKYYSHVQFLFVLGNHDYSKDDKWGLDEELMRRGIANLHCIGKDPQVIELCGLRIGGFGWDAGHRTDRYLFRYEQNESDFRGVDMLVMHCPPRIKGVDLHGGDLGLALVVWEVNPKIVVCGHAHKQDGVYHLGGVPVYCVAGKATMLSVD